MADLGDFLGNLVSSISDSRVNSDLHTVRIAKEYAKDDLLQYFSVPRMRIENVEMTIPIAIDEFSQKPIINPVPINIDIFKNITYRQILKAISIEKLPEEISKEVLISIDENIKKLDESLKSNRFEGLLFNYSMSISEIVVRKISIIHRVLKLRLLSKEQIIAVKNNLVISLQENLKDEIKYVETKSTLPYANIIVETAKLKEIKAENIIIIKMKVSEEGMEWQKFENDKGKIVTKLIPE